MLVSMREGPEGEEEDKTERGTVRDRRGDAGCTLHFVLGSEYRKDKL